MKFESFRLSDLCLKGEGNLHVVVLNARVMYSILKSNFNYDQISDGTSFQISQRKSQRYESIVLVLFHFIIFSCHINFQLSNFNNVEKLDVNIFSNIMLFILDIINKTSKMYKLAVNYKKYNVFQKFWGKDYLPKTVNLLF